MTNSPMRSLRRQLPRTMSPELRLLRRVTRHRPRSRLHLRLLTLAHRRLRAALPKARSRPLPPLTEMLAVLRLKANRRLPRHRLYPERKARLHLLRLRLQEQNHPLHRPRRRPTTSSRVSRTS
jgi:hypothetical protein